MSLKSKRKHRLKYKTTEQLKDRKESRKKAKEGPDRHVVNRNPE